MTAAGVRTVPVVCRHCGTSGQVMAEARLAFTVEWSKRICLKKQHQVSRESLENVRQAQDECAQEQTRRAEAAADSARREHLRTLPPGPDLGSRKEMRSLYVLRAAADGICLLASNGGGLPVVSRLEPWEQVTSVGLQDTSRMTVTRLVAFGIAAGGMRKAQTLAVWSLRDGPPWSVLLDGHEVQLRGALTSAALEVPPLAALLSHDAVRPPAPAPDRDPDLVDALTRLADLFRDGVLTDEEFEAAKARLLTRT